MSNPTQIAQKPKTHFRDFPVIDAIFSALPRPEMDRQMFPAQFRLALQRNGKRNILKVDVGRNSAECAPQRPGSDEPVGHVGIVHICAGQHPKQSAASARNHEPAESVISRPAISEQAIICRSILVELLEVGRIALTVGVDLKYPRCARL
jgi:hypothetical protein